MRYITCNNHTYACRSSSYMSGVTQYAIQQYCEADRDGYDTLLFPCGCTNIHKGTVSIMWVRMRPSSALNHIIPLLPSSEFPIIVRLFTLLEICIFHVYYIRQWQSMCAKPRANTGKKGLVLWPIVSNTSCACFAQRKAEWMIVQMIWCSVTPASCGTIALASVSTSAALAPAVNFTAAENHLKKITSCMTHI